MGKRGPKPKPSALDKLDGGAGHRRKNRHEPTPDPSTGACPRYLAGNPSAQAIWRSLAPGRVKLGLLAEGDELAFAALCNEAAIYWRASRKLTGALTHDTKANGVTKRPEIDIRRSALDGMTKLAAAFGMTPADRARLEIAPLAPESPHGSDKPAGRTRPAPGVPPVVESIDDHLARVAARRAGTSA